MSTNRTYTNHYCRSLHWERGLKRRCTVKASGDPSSLPSLGAWIETKDRETNIKASVSLPSLGAWIETTSCRRGSSASRGRSLHWERGLKHAGTGILLSAQGRSLHWERGLKHPKRGWEAVRPPAPPSLGAWIETWMALLRWCDPNGRSLHWECGLKRHTPIV